MTARQRPHGKATKRDPGNFESRGGTSSEARQRSRTGVESKKMGRAANSALAGAVSAKVKINERPLVRGVEVVKAFSKPSHKKAKQRRSAQSRFLQSLGVATSHTRKAKRQQELNRHPNDSGCSELVGNGCTFPGEASDSNGRGDVLVRDVQNEGCGSTVGESGEGTSHRLDDVSCNVVLEDLRAPSCDSQPISNGEPTHASVEKKLDYFSSFFEPIDSSLAANLKKRLPAGSSASIQVERQKLSRVKTQESLYLTSTNAPQPDATSSPAKCKEEQLFTVQPEGFASYDDVGVPAYLASALQTEIPEEAFERTNPYGLDAQLLSNARRLLQSVRPQACVSGLSHDEKKKLLTGRALWHYMNSYVDVLMTEQNHESGHECRLLYCLHAVSHVLKSRRKTLNNNEKLKKLVARKEADPSGNTTLQDQGFTRPKVLILAPFRSVAKQVVDFLIQLNPKAKQVMNRKRLNEEYGQTQEEETSQREGFMKTNKKKDFTHLFAGNQDDCFRIGIRFGTSAMALYSDFQFSDIILASPLGLRMLVGTPGEKKREYDFLSSIEIVILDRADVIRMQNWKFLRDVWNVLNLPLSAWPDCDIRRIRESFLRDQAPCFRQSLIFADGRDPLFASLLSQSANFRGGVKLWRPMKRSVVASLARVGARQLFSRAPCPSFSNTGMALVDHFVRRMLPEVASSFSTLLVVPSHVEYCCICPHLNENNIDFKSCHESSSTKKLSSARRQFFEKECQMLVTTVRFLFYRRYRLKGADRIIILGPPEYPQIYEELVEVLEGNSRDVICLYTEFHVNELERLMGASKAVQLISADENKWILIE